LSYLLNPYINIKRLILFLAFSASICTLINSFYSTYQVQKTQIRDYTLKANYAYAKKLASATDDFLQLAQQQLAYSASVIEQDINNQQRQQEEAKRLNLQTNSFNSVVINIKKIITATSPVFESIIGQKLDSVASNDAYNAKKPMISKPFISFANNLVVFISHPLFNTDGTHLGYIGGTLYLKEKNILSKLLKQHYYEGGSYIYVIDSNKQILYHPNISRIGTQVLNNTMLDDVAAGKSGMTEVTNSLNIAMLAGYAPVTRANWGIVAQRPVSTTLASVSDLVVSVVLHTLPSAFIIFIFTGIFAHYISRPLKQLADKAELLSDPKTAIELTSIKAWYFESDRLKQAILKGANIVQAQIGQLRHDANIDPLTGAQNRRSLNDALSQFMQSNIEFTMLEIDIDYFKKVNDSFGHDIGDETLITLVSIIEKMSRKGDITARLGGEEFMLVLPNIGSQAAWPIAQRLREEVALAVFDKVGHITISIGIATWPAHNEDINLVFKSADKALYQAKEEGRNRCIMASK
jgi:diguanylate cyclase (GGDEF)-like protein